MRGADCDVRFMNGRDPAAGKWGRAALRALAMALALCGTASSSWAQTSYSVLSTFTATDGYTPWGELTVGPDGFLYGTTINGGAHNFGTIFRVDQFGLATTLHSFGDVANDGRNPYGGLEIGPDGAFYGTTYNGGAHLRGSIFKITATGTYTLLRSLGAFDSSCGCYPDGYNPYDGLELGTDGLLYGVAQHGGNNSQLGTIFRIAPDGTFEKLHNFAPWNGSAYPEGYRPYGGLVQGSDGLFYGTTRHGGTPNAGSNGTIFKYDPATNTLTVLRNNASATDGYEAGSALVEGSDGFFYGAYRYGGANNFGTVFRIDGAGSFSVVRALSAHNGSYYPDGQHPWAGLVEHSDGNLYGVTTGGGQYGHGAIFKVVPGMTPTFSVIAYMNNNTADRFGAFMYGDLIEGTDGRLYGTTQGGGAVGNGTVFSVDTAGAALDVHHVFNVS